jgi:hypothetical protein
VLHHNLEHDEIKSSEDEHPSSSSGVESDSKIRHPALQQVHSSSSNSVISSVDSSNYDSGAFSRTSSPEAKGRRAGHLGGRRHHRRRQTQQLPNAAAATNLSKSASKSASTLALTAPLCAPSLVLAACATSRSHLSRHFDADEIDAAHILACLDAASASSGQFYSLQNAYPLNPDVSITIGSSTRLTIANSDVSSVRRSRLPLMGVAGLSPKKADVSPAKGLRTKISTVYVSAKEAMMSLPSMPLLRSESFVTVSNPSREHRSCDSKTCTERVTVNGRHHCACDGKKSAFKPMESVADCDLQPGSLINV